jgi:hypothetical protein
MRSMLTIVCAAIKCLRSWVSSYRENIATWAEQFQPEHTSMLQQKHKAVYRLSPSDGVHKTPSKEVGAPEHTTQGVSLYCSFARTSVKQGTVLAQLTPWQQLPACLRLHQANSVGCFAVLVLIQYCLHVVETDTMHVPCAGVLVFKRCRFLRCSQPCTPPTR